MALASSRLADVCNVASWQTRCGSQAPEIVRLLHGRCVLQLILVKSARGAVAVGFDVKYTATPGVPHSMPHQLFQILEIPSPSLATPALFKGRA